MIEFFGYDKCSTCVKAKRYFKSKNIEFRDNDIISKPPSKEALKSALKSGHYQLKDLFNRSGELYRSMNMKDKIGALSEAELLDLLAKNGKLVKRPFITD